MISTNIAHYTSHLFEELPTPKIVRLFELHTGIIIIIINPYAQHATIDEHATRFVGRKNRAINRTKGTCTITKKGPF